eukprot:TRINITY_DN296_c4_g2_i1.p1 TRINITY_DN296_c4_g2~~TRINITY_DN296_c4_g2_i1.p1  ORF type:complete len:774 (-),score=334.55 TRINITY_DN296_c4_g2_i1:26-2161(-)
MTANNARLKAKVVKSLVIDDFDADQIWYQLEMTNVPLTDTLKRKFDKFIDGQTEIDLLSEFETKPKRRKLNSDEDDDIGNEDEDNLEGGPLLEDMDDMDGEDGDDFDIDEGLLDEDELLGDDVDLDGGDDEEEQEEELSKKSKKKSKQNLDVNDADLESKFFSMEAMERFVEQAENEEMGFDLNDDIDELDEDQAAAEIAGEVDDIEGGEEGDEDDDEDDDEYKEIGLKSNIKNAKMDALEMELERALDKQLGIDDKKSKGKSDFVGNKKSKKGTASDAKYDDWFAPAGEDKLNYAEDDAVEDDIDMELAEHHAILDGKVDNGEEDEDDDDMNEDGGGEEDDEDGDAKQKDNEDTKTMSKHEKEMLKMKKLIEKGEKELITDKEWQFKGESSARKRPKNSLLSEDLDYENTAKLKPAITEEHTRTLEDIIKYRISEGAFDDVIRKRFDDDHDKGDWRPLSVELDHEKSKQSLAEVYEDEYKTQVMGEKKSSDREIQQDETNRLFMIINRMLDGLSHQSFIPTKTRDTNAGRFSHESTKNVSAVAVEDAVPINVSDAQQLAPEEIYQKHDKLLASRSELLREEKKRARASNKEKKQKDKKDKEYKKSQREKAKKQQDEESGKKKKDDDKNITKQSVDKAVKQIKESGDKNISFIKGTDTTNYSQSASLFRKLQEEAKKEAKSYQKGDGNNNNNNNNNKKKDRADNKINSFKL